MENVNQFQHHPLFPDRESPFDPPLAWIYVYKRLENGGPSGRNHMGQHVLTCAAQEVMDEGDIRAKLKAVGLVSHGRFNISGRDYDKRMFIARNDIDLAPLPGDVTAGAQGQPQAAGMPGMPGMPPGMAMPTNPLELMTFLMSMMRMMGMGPGQQQSAAGADLDKVMAMNQQNQNAMLTVLRDSMERDREQAANMLQVVTTAMGSRMQDYKEMAAAQNTGPSTSEAIRAGVELAENTLATAINLREQIAETVAGEGEGQVTELVNGVVSGIQGIAELNRQKAAAQQPQQQQGNNGNGAAH
jgi:hypothetical protein